MWLTPIEAGQFIFQMADYGASREAYRRALERDSRLASAYAGLGSYDQVAQPEMGVEPEVNAKAMKADLKRWQSVARRMVKMGENPSDYDFKSEHIPVNLISWIRMWLDGVQDDEEVRAAFAGPFRETGGNRYQTRHLVQRYSTAYP